MRLRVLKSIENFSISCNRCLEGEHFFSKWVMSGIKKKLAL
jgi:hypothetical protein